MNLRKKIGIAAVAVSVFAGALSVTSHACGHSIYPPMYAVSPSEEGRVAERIKHNLEHKAPSLFIMRYYEILMEMCNKEEDLSKDAKNAIVDVFESVISHRRYDVFESMIRKTPVNVVKNCDFFRNKLLKHVIHIFAKEKNYDLISRYEILMHDSGFDFKDWRDPETNQTMLHLLLLEEGCDKKSFEWLLGVVASVVDVQDDRGETALHIAMKKGYWDIAQLLSIDGDARVDLADREGKKAINYLLSGNVNEMKKAIFKYLLDRNLIPSITELSNRELENFYSCLHREKLIELVTENPKLMIIPCTGGRTLLTTAASVGDEKNEMLFAKAKEHNYLEEVDGQQDTPLKVAVSCERQKDVEILLDCGVKVQNIDIEEVLDRTYDQGYEDFLKFFIERLGLPNTYRNANSGRTLLHYVMRIGDLEFAKKYIGEKPDPDLINQIDKERGRAPLYSAIESKNLDLIKYLIEKCGCKIFEDKSIPDDYPLPITDLDGITPGMYAKRLNCSREICEYLIDEKGICPLLPGMPCISLCAQKRIALDRRRMPLELQLSWLSDLLGIVKEGDALNEEEDCKAAYKRLVRSREDVEDLCEIKRQKCEVLRRRAEEQKREIEESVEAVRRAGQALHEAKAELEKVAAEADEAREAKRRADESYNSRCRELEEIEQRKKIVGRVITRRQEEQFCESCYEDHDTENGKLGLFGHGVCSYFIHVRCLENWLKDHHTCIHCLKQCDIREVMSMEAAQAEQQTLEKRKEECKEMAEEEQRRAEIAQHELEEVCEAERKARAKVDECEEIKKAADERAEEARRNLEEARRNLEEARRNLEEASAKEKIWMEKIEKMKREAEKVHEQKKEADESVSRKDLKEEEDIATKYEDENEDD